MPRSPSGAPQAVEDAGPIVPSPFRSWWKLVSNDCNAALVPDATSKALETQLPLLSVFHTVILIGACHLPGHLIPARRLLRANRHPGPPLAKLTGHNRRPAIAQLNRRPAIRMKKIVAPILNQAGRSECLDHRRAPAGGGGGAATGPIVPSPFRSCWKLVSSDCNAALVPDATSRALEMQLPLLSVFHTVILIGAGHLPGHLIPACRLLRANRHPGRHWPN